MAETLKEWLVSLGWNVEQTKHDQGQFESAILSATLKANILGDVLVAIAKKIGEAVQEAATKFDNLYFAAQRANTSAALANDFPLLIKKYGGSPQQAAALLEAAAAKLRENRGNITILNKLGFGIDATTGKLEIQKAMLENLRHLDDQQIESLTAQLGIADQPILLMKRHLDEILPDLKSFSDYRDSLGLDVEKAAVDGNTFQTLWRRLEFMLGAIADRIGAGLTLAVTPLLDQLNKFIKLDAKAITDAIMIVVNALAEMFKYWAADFDKILMDPDQTQAFEANVRSLANAIAHLAESLSNLVGWLKAFNQAGQPAADVLNYLSGNKNDAASYERGRATVSPNDAEIVKKLNADKDAPPAPWDWKGAASGAWGWVKKQFTADAAPAPGGASGPAATGGAFVIGDSLGQGVKDALRAPGVTQVGVGASAILAQIGALRPEQLANKTVILSGGASNSHDPAALTAQINLLRSKGVSPENIRVLGVGSRPDFAGFNERLQKTAEDAGATFVPITSGPGGVHPTGQGYREAAAAAMVAKRATAPAPKPSPYGELAPFTVPAVNPSLWNSPLTLGGAGGDTTISAPSQTTIHVDGTGDPTAVAHLVHGAQKGVNADLSQTLQQATP